MKDSSGVEAGFWLSELPVGSLQVAHTQGPLLSPPPTPSVLDISSDLEFIAFVQEFSSSALLTFGAGSFFVGCGGGFCTL